jgi:inosine/xanthosine triphosphatase
MIVHVATSNPVKIRAVRAAFGRAARVIAVAAKGDAPAQPVSLGQIVKGATSRARRAVGRADFGVGVESGVFRLGGAWYNVTLAAVTDGARLEIGGGPFFRIPDRLVHAIAKGEEELGDRFAGRGIGAVGAATGGRVTREEATRLAVEMALARWRSPRIYE